MAALIGATAVYDDEADWNDTSPQPNFSDSKSGTSDPAVNAPLIWPVFGLFPGHTNDQVSVQATGRETWGVVG
jgi:hypothetical protein